MSKKTCAMDSPTHPWVDASKTSLNSVFQALQKRPLGLPVKGSLRDSTLYDIACDMGYSRPSLLKDLRILKELKAHGMHLLQTSNCLQTSSSLSSGGLTVLSESDVLVNQSNP